MTCIAAETEAPPLRRIEEIAGREIGRPVRAAAAQRLTARQGIEVWRVGLEPGAPWSSIIAKRLLAGHEENRHDLLRESLNYVFLSELRPAFELFPRLVGRGENLLVLEDLGEDAYDYPSEEAAWESVAITLARLHAASAGREDRFAAIQQEMTERRKVRNGDALFRQGVQILEELSRDLGLPQGGWGATLRAIGEEMEEPGPFLAFIHDDLVSRRQSVTRDGRFHLLDFEWAEYSHALLDISRLLVGKLEQSKRHRRYFLHRPDFPLEFVSVYRRELETLRGAAFDGEVWTRALGSALIYTTLGVLSVLLRLPPGLRAMTSPGLCLKGLLDRTASLLRRAGIHPEVRGLFVRLSARIDLRSGSAAP